MKGKSGRILLIRKLFYHRLHGFSGHVICGEHPFVRVSMAGIFVLLQIPLKRSC